MIESATLQGILDRYLASYTHSQRLDSRRLAVCRHLRQCRTAALGGM